MVSDVVKQKVPSAFLPLFKKNINSCFVLLIPEWLHFIGVSACNIGGGKKTDMAGNASCSKAKKNVLAFDVPGIVPRWSLDSRRYCRFYVRACIRQYSSETCAGSGTQV